MQHVFRLEPGERRLLLRGDRLGVIESGLEIAAVEPDQQLPGLDMLVVGHQNLRDEARDMRRHGRDVAAGIGVVGAFDKAADAPPIAPVSDAAQGDGECQAGERQMPASELQPAFHWSGGRRSFENDGIHHSLHRIAKSFARSRT